MCLADICGDPLGMLFVVQAVALSSQLLDRATALSRRTADLVMARLVYFYSLACERQGACHV